MFKKMWKDEEGVSPVIATILMVAITVVLAGVLVVYMQQFSSGPGTQAPVATAIARTFTNPYDGVGATQTANYGGWTVQIQKVSGQTTPWANVKVSVQTSNGVPVFAQDGVKTSNAWFYQSNGTGSLHWFIYRTATAVAPQYNTGAAKAAIVTTLSGDQFNTIQDAQVVVMDSNGNNNFDASDQVFVYASNNHDLLPEISVGYQVSFSTGGGNICVTTLN